MLNDHRHSHNVSYRTQNKARNLLAVATSALRRSFQNLTRYQATKSTRGYSDCPKQRHIFEPEWIDWARSQAHVESVSTARRLPQLAFASGKLFGIHHQSWLLEDKNNLWKPLGKLLFPRASTNKTISGVEWYWLPRLCGRIGRPWPYITKSVLQVL